MNIREDAIATSAMQMTSEDLEQMLAVRSRSAPPPLAWSFETDAETRTSPETPDAKVASELFGAVATPVAAEPSAARPDIERVLAPIRGALREPMEDDVRRRADELVGLLSGELARMDLTGLPAAHATVGSDGAFLIEWTNGRRRIGLNVEQQAAESSWYFVSLEPGGIASASGTMADLDLPALLRRLAQR